MSLDNSSAPTTVEETTINTTESTTLLTTTPLKGDVDTGMSPSGIAGVSIGAIIVVCIIVVITILILIKYRVIRKKGSEEYNKTIKDLKINTLPSPEEVEREEIRPLERMPTTGGPEIESDFGSSTKHYQNIQDTKYENVTDAADTQPIYLEPEPGAEKRLYTTAEGSEYYMVDDLEKANPNLPSRDDYKKQPTAVSKNKTANNQNKTHKTANNVKAQTDESSSGSSETDSDSECKPTFHTTKDYVNVKDENITIPPPENIMKGRPPKKSLSVDDVYENEEMSRSPRVNIKLS